MSKELEVLEDIKYGSFVSFQEECEGYDVIEKALKALEIIKREPSAVIETITTYDSWEEYINDYPLSDKTIWHIIKTKDEFNLLKEVLL